MPRTGVMGHGDKEMGPLPDNLPDDVTADRTPTSEGPRTLTPDEERFRGLVGAWNDDTPLADSIRLFADMMSPQYRGWAEMMRGWAFRIDREAEAAASPEERGGGADSRVAMAQIDLAAQYAIAFMTDPEGLALRREEWRDQLSEALLALRATPAAPSEPAPLDVERLARQELAETACFIEAHTDEWPCPAHAEWAEAMVIAMKARHQSRLDVVLSAARHQSTPTPTEEPT